VSLFIDPEPHQVEAAAMLGAAFVELHTGPYATSADADFANLNRVEAQVKSRLSRSSAGASRGARGTRPGINAKIGLGEQAGAELEKVRAAVKLARSLKLKPNAGHGLNYLNVGPIAAIPGLVWLHIGHAIVARSVLVGMGRAVREMNGLINGTAGLSRRR
jgi:pyridoxine 5-phosphate synthase